MGQICHGIPTFSAHPARKKITISILKPKPIRISILKPKPIHITQPRFPSPSPLGASFPTPPSKRRPPPGSSPAPAPAHLPAAGRGTQACSPSPSPPATPPQVCPPNPIRRSNPTTAGHGASAVLMPPLLAGPRRPLPTGWRPRLTCRPSGWRPWLLCRPAACELLPGAWRPAPLGPTRLVQISLLYGHEFNLLRKILLYVFQFLYST